MTPDREILAEYEAVAQEAQTMAFLPRASELQEATEKQIDSFLQRLADRKTVYVQAADEHAANCVLAMEFALRAVRAELDMWLRLKREDSERAWEDLITAQELMRAAIMVRQQLGFDVAGLENVSRRLLFIERWVFPPQSFMSVGGIAHRRECSICGGEYDGCDHVIGRAYSGKMCHTIIQECTLDEVSIVANPADKRCRVTSFGDQGKVRNKMTWRLEDRPGVGNGPTET